MSKDYSKISMTELNKLIQDIVSQHNLVKENIFNLLNEIENIEKKINSEVEKLDKIEKKYIDLIEELNNR